MKVCENSLNCSCNLSTNALLLRNEDRWVLCQVLWGLLPRTRHRLPPTCCRQCPVLAPRSYWSVLLPGSVRNLSKGCYSLSHSFQDLSHFAMRLFILVQFLWTLGGSSFLSDRICPCFPRTANPYGNASRREGFPSSGSSVMELRAFSSPLRSFAWHPLSLHPRGTSTAPQEGTQSGSVCY